MSSNPKYKPNRCCQTFGLLAAAFLAAAFAAGFGLAAGFGVGSDPDSLPEPLEMARQGLPRLGIRGDCGGLPFSKEISKCRKTCPGLKSAHLEQRMVAPTIFKKQCPNFGKPKIAPDVLNSTQEWFVQQINVF
jgi:hypothetical protein